MCSLSITLSETESSCVIRFEDSVDITSATELKQTLLQALAAGRELKVDLAAAGKLDITAIQLLWAAARAAEKSGTAFAVEEEMPESIRGAFRDTGLEALLHTSMVKSETMDCTAVSTDMPNDGH